MNKKEDNNSQNSNNSTTSNNSNVNENKKREKRTRIRPSKAERYSKEREEFVKELNILTGINEKNNIILYELNKNEKLKEKIRELVPLIKKYYKTCNWGYFSNDEKKGKGNEIGLLKTIYKNEGYKILTKRKLCEYEGIKKLQTELYFLKL